ncbi:T9SS type A sorting domain-containing protein [uncultured Bacteroides sp.]|uniref:T9SS type A sorting domain-containing protein n=1 Tax=uncultured Bacteroides sp. TaxID=162156 RepID=UPI002AAA8E7A|nr:T9SS type A sorting domain-containing protein [uncultured Bacteroides sp.]
MQYKTGNICRYNDNSGNHIVRPAMICMDTVHLVNKKMQKESIIIKEIRPNISVLQGPEVKVYPHSESNSLLVEIIENSKNIKASIFIFTLTGKLLQMIQVKDARTVVHIPSLENGKYLMNIQIGRDVSTWKITKE